MLITFIVRYILSTILERRPTMNETIMNKEIEKAQEVLALVTDVFDRARDMDREELLDLFLKTKMALAHTNQIAIYLNVIRRAAAEKIVEDGPTGWGWSQAKLAREAGISPSRVHQLLNALDDENVEESRDQARLSLFEAKVT